MTRPARAPRSRDELRRAGWRWALVVLLLLPACAACSRQDAVEAASVPAQGGANEKAPDEPAPPRTPRPGRQMVDVEIPRPTGHVTDQARLLSPDEARALEARLVAHETDTGQQLALLTLERLPGVNIDDLGYTVANRWKLGRACFDDGVLLLIAFADRALRIDVGYGLERAIPDARAAQVIEEMAPLLRLGQFAEAANLAFDRLITAATATPALRSHDCTDRAP